MRKEDDGWQEMLKVQVAFKQGTESRKEIARQRLTCWLCSEDANETACARGTTKQLRGPSALAITKYAEIGE